MPPLLGHAPSSARISVSGFLRWLLEIVHHRCDDAPEFISATESLVAVAGVNSAAHQVERPDQVTKSLIPVKSASLAEGAAKARIERVIEPAQPEQTMSCKTNLALS